MEIGVELSPPLGLSPRVRGNPRRSPSCAACWRSIPAGAGESAESDRVCERHRVYPRGCGGILVGNRDPQPPLGLSPRVRGNLAGNAALIDRVGSIPAGAGESCT